MFVGEESDFFSFQRWIRELDRNAKCIWSGGPGLEKVKNFRALEDLVETILEGCVLAAVSESAGLSSVADLSLKDNIVSSEKMDIIKNAIANVAAWLSDFNHTAIL